MFSEDQRRKVIHRSNGVDVWVQTTVAGQQSLGVTIYEKIERSGTSTNIQWSDTEENVVHQWAQRKADIMAGRKEYGFMWPDLAAFERALVALSEAGSNPVCSVRPWANPIKTTK